MHWIRARRRELNLSQEELSARLQIKGFDVSRATLGHWEQGRYFPPINEPEFAHALADALQLTLLDMFVRAGLDFRLADEEAEIGAAIIHRMPDTRKKTALVLLEQLLKEG